MDWLNVVQELQSIARAGLTYSSGPYDLERYEKLLNLAARIAAGPLGTSVTHVEEILRAEKGYATPKVDVRAVVPRDGALLLVRESQDGLWSLPGGWADIGSTPSEMAAREVFEETGYLVRPVKLVAVNDKSKHEHPRDHWWTYKLFFLCELEGGEPKTSHETLEIGFFRESELPPLSLPRNTPGQLRRMFAHARSPDLPTDFD
jgi:ADP-ribose pyrophosphatase YjhB (NUDIX family)